MQRFTLKNTTSSCRYLQVCRTVCTRTKDNTGQNEIAYKLVWAAARKVIDKTRLETFEVDCEITERDWLSDRLDNTGF